MAEKHLSSIMLKRLFTLLLAMAATQLAAQSNNLTFTSEVEAGLPAAFTRNAGIGNPTSADNLKPYLSSQISSNGSFTHALLSGTFFTTTTYAGAIDPNGANWAAESWVNWDPFNTLYATAPVANDLKKAFSIGGVTIQDNAGVAEIQANMTLTEGVYKISEDIFVTNGATLTIEPGTIIRGTGSLVITRGSKLVAAGTAAKPIVFTSNKAVGARATSDAGGIVILGRAKNSATNNYASIEGFPAGSAALRYGYGDGNFTQDDQDSSGVLRYVRIEFGGKVLTNNNEINSLTLGAVGSKTVIDHVQCSYGADDAFEWFGGTVSAKYLIAFGTYDDEFDTSFGFDGKVQFVIGMRDPVRIDITNNEARGIESDGREGSWNFPLNPPTNAVFSNMTLIGPALNGKPDPNTGIGSNNIGAAVLLRRNSSMRVFNSVFAGYPKFFVAGDVETADNSVAAVAGRDSSVVFNNNVLIGTNTTKFEAPAAATTLIAEMANWATTGTPSSRSLNSSLVNEVRVYPNPASSTVNFAYSLNQAATARITLTDMTGRTLATLTGNGATGSQTLTYDISSLAPGIYIATLSVEGAGSQSFRFSVVK